MEQGAKLKTKGRSVDAQELLLCSYGGLWYIGVGLGGVILVADTFRYMSDEHEWRGDMFLSEAAKELLFYIYLRMSIYIGHGDERTSTPPKNEPLGIMLDLALHAHLWSFPRSQKKAGDDDQRLGVGGRIARAGSIVGPGWRDSSGFMLSWHLARLVWSGSPIEIQSHAQVRCCQDLGWSILSHLGITWEDIQVEADMLGCWEMAPEFLI